MSFDPQKKELNEILKDGLLSIALGVWGILFMLILSEVLR